MQCLQHLFRHYEVSWVLPLSNTLGSCYQYKGRVSLSVHSLGLVINMLICTGPLYQYREVGWARAFLSVQWIDNEVSLQRTYDQGLPPPRKDSPVKLGKAIVKKPRRVGGINQELQGVDNYRNHGTQIISLADLTEFDNDAWSFFL